LSFHGLPRCQVEGYRIAALASPPYLRYCLPDWREWFSAPPCGTRCLPAQLIQMGVSAVVNTPRAVDDLPTSLLTGEFHRRHLEEGQGPAEALRGAQLWLRDATAGEMKLAEHYQRL
jgi:hypothetical protein